MNFNIASVIEISLYFLALINPASKVFFLTAHQPALTTKELRHIARRASFFALIILAGSAAGGKVILENIFKVELYALQLSGGLVLLFSGLAAVQKGVFYHEQDNKHVSHAELSVVPLAAPLIGISGIGGKLALNILGAMPVQNFCAAVTAGDVKALSLINGIGKRTAERIIVELKDIAAQFD